MERFRRDVQIKFFFAEETMDTDSEYSEFYSHKLYIKSKWIPPNAFGSVKNKIEAFENNLRRLQLNKLSNTRASTNLIGVQEQLIKTLHTNLDFIILPTDKNLGPAIMERQRYVEHVLREHLCDTEQYQHLSTEDGEARINNFYTNLKRLLVKYKNCMTDFEKKYFDRSMTGDHRIPQFYGTPKVHKPMTPYVKLRPVSSQCGSITAVASVYVDAKLQPLSRKVPDYVLNSTTVLNALKKLNQLPSTAKFFTSDVVAMYANIDPDEGIPAIGNDCEAEINYSLIIDVLTLIMNNNVFQFGDSWWRQRIGTAMGTSCLVSMQLYFSPFLNEL